jgi:hypothetical protein
MATRRLSAAVLSAARSGAAPAATAWAALDEANRGPRAVGRDQYRVDGAGRLGLRQVNASDSDKPVSLASHAAASPAR